MLPAAAGRLAHRRRRRREFHGAIRSGLYKAVNILGVSVITAVVNVAKPLTIPYMFGGDGASLCIPPALVTCLISPRAGAHFHFVDGSDGGYAMAAAEMKRQLRELKG